MKKITASQMAELSYSPEYLQWLREAFGRMYNYNLNTSVYESFMNALVGFDEFLEEKGYSYLL